MAKTPSLFLPPSLGGFTVADQFSLLDWENCHRSQIWENSSNPRTISGFRYSGSKIMVPSKASTRPLCLGIPNFSGKSVLMRAMVFMKAFGAPSSFIFPSFHKDGFKIIATGRTYELIAQAGIPVTRVNKLYEGRPNILDMITNGDIQLIVNSPSGKESVHDDSYLRKSAIKAKIPYMTTMAAAKATAKGIRYVKEHGQGQVKSLQELHKEIHDKD